ncbi:alpha,alpha-trehalase [Reichenbachiella faecimaris]|uniref:Alpha,alpha-trehalase n=2 Tax=Reichenbachiella faecimaris TaxID=692418 RepID=A0A1W2GLY1_REIFA|nr:alpha,alpha-trehalase [Reichenbachiella faecimaris]
MLVCYACQIGDTDQTVEPFQSSQASVPHPPAKVFGSLLYEVQTSRIFDDGKTFVDCVPKVAPDSIMKAYMANKGNANFDLKTFVNTYFDQPYKHPVYNEEQDTASLIDHIDKLWGTLKRPADSAVFGSRIQLPYPYVVPGGRFREIYYWDSYFTMLGLEVSGEHQLIEDMVKNFAEMIDRFGFIPNGSRTYFLGRSQPPFFALMINLLASIKGKSVWVEYLPYLQKEYDFWMTGADSLTVQNATSQRVVLLDSKYVLNRYWDNFDGPREESLAEDVLLARESGREESLVFRHLRAGAESGWDYSSRWFADGNTLKTIETTNIIPVDLNALIYYLEQTIAKGYKQTGQDALAAEYEGKAQIRREALNFYCWDEVLGYFIDYNFKFKTHTSNPSLAGVFPLSFEIADASQAEKVSDFIQQNFLKDGGLISTLNYTGEQWDAPNGWPPLQWMSFWGLKNYDKDSLANTIAKRWVSLNERVYQRTGKMMEKYNVEDLTLEGGGGEYPLQDGFGWTNGVYLKMKSELEQN